jgi:hypothetical protein
MQFVDITRVWQQHSRLRFVKGVQKHHHTQTSEGIDERGQQSHRRHQTSHNAEYVADESRHQQDRCQDHANQRQKCCILECHGRSISALRAIRNGRFEANVTALDELRTIVGGTGTDDGNCLEALAEPQVRCRFEGFKTKIGGPFLNLRPASDALE